MKKKIITIQFVFFKNQDPEMLERLFRRLSKERKFPPFSKCIVMVHHKNLKQRNLKEEFPLMVDENDIKKRDLS